MCTELTRLGSLLALALCVACTSPQKPAGQLVVSIETDMSLPDQVDTVRVQVLVHGETFLDQSYPVGTPDDNLIPATLTLVAGRDPSQPVSIRVSGGQHGGAWRTFREVTTTVPADRSAALRMPIQWLCDGTATMRTTPGVDGRPTDELASTCPDGSTCMAGACKQSAVPEPQLPDFTLEAEYGGASTPALGTCFDTLSCMRAGSLVQPDADCTVPKPAGSDTLNVALRVPNGGICDATGLTCFVPLNGDSVEGWSLNANGDRIQLPTPACDKLTAGQVTGIYVSSACATKTEAVPPCGDWSSVHGTTSAPSADVASSPPPTATKFASLVTAGGGAAPCCPLLTDGSSLYSCSCQTKASASVVAVSLSSSAVSTVTTLDTPSGRQNNLFAAAVQDGTFFWVDAVANAVQRVALETGKASPTLAIDGEITEATPLLVDSASMYLLASAVTGAVGSAVQLLALDRALGTVHSYDTGSNFHVHQFAQDDRFVYLVSDDDSASGSGVVRDSRVVRLSKSDGTKSDVSSGVSLTLPTKSHGGYIGVQTDLDGGSALYALYEDAPQKDGTIPTRVVRFDAGSTSPSSLYERALDPTRSSLWLLGVVGGTVLVAQTQSGSASESVASASVIALPASGGPPLIVADFANDYPILGLQALVADATAMYWLNSSGDVFQLPRAGLE